MGLYVNENEVRSWVTGKIRFTDDTENEPDKMGLVLLRQLIDEAEAQVEVDLSVRYSAPFQCGSGAPFSAINRTTRIYLRTMCQLMVIVRLMETDFGRATGEAGAKYAEASQKRYDGMIKQQMALKENSYNTYVYPPLMGLRLSYQNEEGDTGFKGRVLTLNADANDQSVAEQINSPGEDFWNGRILE